MEAAGRKFGFRFDWVEFPWGCEHYTKTGRMMPEDGLDQLRPFEAIYFGAVGFPGVPDHVSLWGLLIPMRRGFRQYANIRPVRLFPGLRSPLANRAPGDIDYVVVRENNEGEYSAVGGRMYEGTDDEVVVQQSTFTRKGVDRILRYAFELARSRPKKHLTSATKSNGIAITMPFWDERFAAMAQHYPDVRTDQYHIDILSAHFVQHPDWFDVVVGSNLFGDILSDLGPATTGTIAIAPSANLNPEREYPVPLRARARLRARHLRPQHREPDRTGLVGRDDAGAPGSPGGRCGGHAGDRNRARRRSPHARPGREIQHAGVGSRPRRGDLTSPHAAGCDIIRSAVRRRP